MNKKLFDKRFGLIFTLLLCLGAAVLFWLFVKYCEAYGVESISSIAAVLE